MVRYRWVVGGMLLLLAGCMEGQKPKPEVRVPSLYVRLHGEEGLRKIVDDFVDKVVASENIREMHKKHFREGDVAGLKRKLLDQLGEATGGPEKYSGKNMKDAHQGLGITDADFDALVDSLKTALEQNHVGKAEQDELLGMLGSLRKEVVEK
jgi:hemoglobin